MFKQCRYTYDDTGAVILLEGSFFNPNYTQDPENPNRYIPNFPECNSRRVQLHIMPCGKRIGNWKCDKFNKTISVRDCENCNVRTK